MERSINPLMKIVYYTTKDGVKLVLINNIDGNVANDSIISGDIIRDVTESVSSMSLVLDNSDGNNTRLFSGGEYIEVYIDYDDRRLTKDLSTGLVFFSGESGSGVINLVGDD